MTGSPVWSDTTSASSPAHGVDGNGRPPSVQALPVELAANAETRATPAITSHRREPLAGGRLLVTDLRVAYLLANEARYRSLERVFGVSRDQANLVTFMLLVMAADAVHDKVEHAIHGLGGPSRADALLGTVGASELLGGIAGQPARDTPMFGPLVALALVGGLYHPAVRRSMRGIRSSSHQTLVAFRHRYGYLVAHGRRIARARRVQERTESGEVTPVATGNGEVASRIRKVAA